MAIIGIDLGTSNSAAAVLRGGRPVIDRKWAHDRTSPVGRLDTGLDEARAKAKGWTVVAMKTD